MSEDYGMLYIPELNLLVKIRKDEEGLYVRLPSKKGKFRLEEVEWK